MGGAQDGVEVPHRVGLLGQGGGLGSLDRGGTVQERLGVAHPVGHGQRRVGRREPGQAGHEVSFVLGEHRGQLTGDLVGDHLDLPR